MIKAEDLFDDSLFDKQTKDAVLLGAALDDLEQGFLDILKTTEKLSTKDAFKSYEKLKTLENNLNKLEAALKGVEAVEEKRTELTKEIIPLQAKYEDELSTLIVTNDKLRKEISDLNSIKEKDVITTNKLTTALDINNKRINTLTNSTRVLQGVTERNTVATIESIVQYRTLSTLLDEITSKKVPEINLGSPKKVNALTAAVAGFIDSLATSEVDDFNKSLSATQRIALRVKSALDALSKSAAKAAKSSAKAAAGAGAGIAIGASAILGGATGAAGQSRIIQALLQQVSFGISSLATILLDKFNLLVSVIQSVPGFTGNTGDTKIVATSSTGKTVLGTTQSFRGEALELSPLEVQKLVSISSDNAKIFQDVLANLASPGQFLKDTNLLLSRVIERELNRLDIEAKQAENKLIADFVKEVRLAATPADEIVLRNKLDLELNKLRSERDKAKENIAGTQGVQEFREIRGFLNEILKRSDERGEEFPLVRKELQAVLDARLKLPEDAVVKLETGDEELGFLDNISNFFSNLNKSAQELTKLQLQSDAARLKLVDEELKFQAALAKATDDTTSLEARQRAARSLFGFVGTSEAATGSLESLELQAANANLKLREAELRASLPTELTANFKTTEDLVRLIESASPALAAASQESVDAFSDAVESQKAIVASANIRFKEVLALNRQIRSDILDLQLDTFIDNADKLKTVNEGIITDETETLAKRRKVLKDTESILEESFGAQLDVIVAAGKELGVTGVNRGDIAGLVGITDIVELDKQIRALGFSEQVTIRLQEIVRERQQAIEDFRVLNKELDIAATELRFTQQDTELLQKYLDALKKQDEELQNILVGGDSKTINAKIDEGIALETEFLEASLKLKVEQAKEALKINQDAGLETINEAKELNEALLDLAEFYKDKQEKLRKEELASKEEDAKKSAEIEAKRLQREQDITTAAFAVLNALNEKAANQRLSVIDRQIADVASREQLLINLAEKGSEDLLSNLAFEQKKLAELELKRDKADKARARNALVLSFLETYAANLSALKQENQSAIAAGGLAPNPNPGLQALSKTAVDVALLQTLVNALPGFYDGTEDTGSGGDLDSKKGFLAVLHPHERVLTAEQNKKIIGLSNTELVAKAVDNTIEDKLTELISITKNKETYLGGDYDAMRKTFKETIKQSDNIKRKHYKVNSIF